MKNVSLFCICSSVALSALTLPGIPEPFIGNDHLSPMTIIAPSEITTMVRAQYFATKDGDQRLFHLGEFIVKDSQLIVVPILTSPVAPTIIESYSLDLAGNVVGASSNRGGWSSTYDSKIPVTYHQFTKGSSLRSSYTQVFTYENGILKTRIETGGRGNNYHRWSWKDTTTFLYDSQGRLDSIVTNGVTDYANKMGNSSSTPKQSLITLTYSSDAVHCKSINENGTVQSYEYGYQGTLLKSEHHIDSTGVEFGIAYDYSNRKCSKKVATAGQTVVSTSNNFYAPNGALFSSVVISGDDKTITVFKTGIPAVDNMVAIDPATLVEPVSLSSKSNCSQIATAVASGGKLYISKAQEGNSVSLYSVSGRLVREFGTITGGSMEFSTGSIPAGVYFLQVGDLKQKLLLQ